MKQPLDHQKKAIEMAKVHYQAHDRGQLVMACGAGKTLTSLWISEALSCQKILVMLPNLVLMQQTVFEWIKNTSICPLKYLSVCSDPSIAQDEEDSPVKDLKDLEIPVTTVPDEIRDFIHLNLDKPFVIFSTYQSSAVLAKVVSLFNNFKFDMIICDEAHRTTGAAEKLFSAVLLDKFIPAKRRLFMTATPRVLSNHVINQGVEEDLELFSMSDEKIYGKEFFRFSYGEAIRAGILVDYKIVISIVTSDDVKEILKKHPKIKFSKKGVIFTSRELAKEIAFLKAVAKHQINHCISFHSKIKKAQKFCDGVLSTGRLMQEMGSLNSSISSFHVNGEMNAASRVEIIERFIAKTPSLITNARCLAEGVDIPKADGIFFYNPKYSVADIVQATGRALRRADSKKMAYLIIPVFADDEHDNELFLESGDFVHVWQVIKAMQAHDDRLEGTISSLQIAHGLKKTVITSDNKESGVYARKLFEKIKVEGKVRSIDFHVFTANIETKLLREVGSSWDYYFGVLKAYRLSFPDRWPKHNEKFNDSSIGQWCQLQKKYQRTEKLEEKKLHLLLSIGFVFSHRLARWKDRIRLLKEYRMLYPKQWPVADEKFCNFGLGTWSQKQLSAYKEGKLNQSRYNDLLELGFPFDQDILNDSWKNNFELLKQFRAEHPTKWPAYDEVYEGVRLGAWCQVHRTYLRKNQLDKKRYKQLKALGFIFDPHDRNWEKGFAKLLEFRKKHPNEWPHKKTVLNKFKLGLWCANKRNMLKANKLKPEQRDQLVALNFPLSLPNPAPLKWFKNFQAVKDFRQANPDRWPKKRELFNGFRVGDWCGDQRWYIKMNQMKEDKLELLKSIGFRLLPSQRPKKEKIVTEELLVKEKIKNEIRRKRYGEIVEDFNGEELKKLRKERGLSLEKASALTGVSIVSLSHYERGIYKPRKRTLKKLDALFVSQVQETSSPEDTAKLSYYQRNKEKVLARYNSEQFKQKQKERYEANKDHFRKKAKESYRQQRMRVLTERGKNGIRGSDLYFRLLLNKIRQRCNNPKAQGFSYYGGKGIKCTLTMDDLKTFWQRDKAHDLSKPALIRTDKNRDFNPLNCKFVEMSVASRLNHIEVMNNGLIKKKKLSSSKYFGVVHSKSRNKWQASIQHNGKDYVLGFFDSEEDAAKAYDRKAKEFLGETAILNFPSGLSTS